jgi:hypothetical protein
VATRISTVMGSTVAIATRKNMLDLKRNVLPLL